MQDSQDGVRQELALRALLVQRCQRAYLHDMRGGLQALTSAFDLLGRAARKSTLTPDLLQKTTQLFARASAAHELTLTRSFEDLCADADEPADLDLPELLGEVVRFLQNDAAERNVSLRLAQSEPAVLQARRKNLRFIVMSLLTHGIDHSAPAAVITVRIDPRPRSSIHIAGMTGALEERAGAPLVPVVKRLLALDGGTMTADSESLWLQW